MAKPQAAFEFAPDHDGVRRQERARACNSTGSLIIATPTTTFSKQEMLETEFVPVTLEM